MSDKPSTVELLDALGNHGFYDELGHPIGQHLNFTELKRRMESDLRDSLYTVEDGWSELYSGTKFYYREPTEDMICFEDIANALGKVSRYAGHTHTFYSVAEHSCLMMRFARRNFVNDNRLLRTILLHDATEAYLPDMARPLKHMMPKFKAFEHAIEPLIAKKFDLINPHPAVVRELDSRILCDERAQAMNPSTNNWGIDVLRPLGVELHFWPPQEAIDNFYGDFMELAP